MKKAKFEKLLFAQFIDRLAVSKMEIEQKFRVENPNFIRERLKLMGATKGMSGTEHNEIYDKDGRLRGEKQILRLRYHGKRHAWLTFKGPRMEGRYKKRLEVETPVHFEGAKQILQLLGYRTISSYRKNREEYILSDAKVSLDELPNSKWFAEIEGAPKTIARVAKELGFDAKDREERSYRKIFREELAAV